MAAKRKSVDSIKAPDSSSVIPAQAGIQKKEEPLLSIIEPEISKKQKAKNREGVIPSKTEESLRDPSTTVGMTDEKKPSFWSRHKKAILITSAAIFTVILTAGLLVGSAYAYQYQYRAKIFPGVYVWGVDAGGKNGPELQRLITEKINTYKLTIKGPDQDYEATAKDLGVNYDTENTISNAFSMGRSGSIIPDNITRIRLLMATIDWEPWKKLIRADDIAVNPTIVVNDEMLNQYVSKIAENINIAAQDSQVNVVSGQIQLKPAIYGRQVLTDELKNQVRGSIADFASEEIAVQTTVLKPTIIDKAAQEVMVQAQNVMQRPVILVYQGIEYKPNQETVGSWISFTKNAGDTKYSLVVDTTKMNGYFDYLGTKINIYPIARKIRVENDTKETETQAGVDGLLIDEVMLGRQIAEQLPVQASIRINIPVYVATFKTEYDRVIVANWDKYIDVNLSAQVMTACERGGVNCKQWYVMTGKNSTPTPIGTWYIQSKRKDFIMYDEARTYELWVPYASFFRADGYAIHSAQWRTNDITDPNGFGNMAYTWNGSHGCVNAPDSAAEYVYYWADKGTPVIVHY